jgi:hypothetical protein
MSEDKTALSFWFPKIAAAGVPVPRTKIITMSKEAQASIWKWFDGEPGNGAEKPFLAELAAAATEMGFPCFLRTDHTSNKHSWQETCFLTSADNIAQHVYNLAEFSEICDMIGIPWTTWVVREFLPTIPLGVCPNYGNMPICREFRYFVDDGKIRCVHPYWPDYALEQGGVDLATFDYKALCAGQVPGLDCLAEEAGKAVGGSWSIDILETRNGWYVTDMAEAHKSFHWDGCPMATDKRRAA